MSKIKPSRDIQPVTEFRANAAQFIEQVQATGEPVILTQHGRSAAVLLDVASYEGMLDELALLRDVRQAEQQVAAGTTVTHAAVAKKLQVVWSPLAEQRAIEAVDYIARDRPRTAAVWLEKLLERVSQLDQFEQQGRVVREIRRKSMTHNLSLLLTATTRYAV